MHRLEFFVAIISVYFLVWIGLVFVAVYRADKAKSLRRKSYALRIFALIFVALLSFGIRGFTNTKFPYWQADVENIILPITFVIGGQSGTA
jgi:hypothetical protein